MKKSFNILTALIIAIFTVSFGGMTSLADGESYENIKDGEYEIIAKALHADKDEKSGAAGFISEAAILSIKDGKAQLRITIPSNDMAEIEGLQIEGIEPTVEENDDVKHKTYTLRSLESELNAQVQYSVPSLNMEHDVPFRFILEGLDDLPIVADESGDSDNDKSDETEDGESSEQDDESEEPEESGQTDQNGDDEDGDNGQTIGNDNGESGTDGQTSESGSGGQVENPQTGDQTNIMLYVMLLIGSLIPLAIILGRRFSFNK